MVTSVTPAPSRSSPTSLVDSILSWLSNLANVVGVRFRFKMSFLVRNLCPWSEMPATNVKELELSKLQVTLFLHHANNFIHQTNPTPLRHGPVPTHFPQHRDHVPSCFPLSLTFPLQISTESNKHRTWGCMQPYICHHIIYGCQHMENITHLYFKQ